MKNTLILLLLFTSFLVHAQKVQIEGPLVHSVYFWLHQPNDTADRLAFETAIKKLIATNPQGVSAFLGVPASTEVRDVVETGYTYAYMMTFANKSAEAAYQSDPTHLQFIDEASHLWDRVQVFDALALPTGDQNP